MADEFLSGVQIGGNLANLGQMRAERMMQLRAQAALQAVQERHLAAQADQIAQQVQFAQAEKEQKDKDLAIADVTHQALIARGVPAEQAQKTTDAWLVGKNPRAALEIGQARSALAKPGLEEAQAEMDRRRFSAENQFRSTVYQPLDEITGQPAVDEEGKPVRVLAKGKGSVEQLSKEPGDVAKIRAFVEAHKQAVKSGDNDMAEALRGGLTKATTGTGFSLQTNPDGTFTLTQGPLGGPDQLTKQNQSKVQEQQAKALETVDTAQRLKPLISNETVGMEAFAKSWINDRILAQRFPELASSKRAQASQLFAELRSNAVKSFRSDSNISEPERKEILGGFPKANDPVDSPARARMVVDQTETIAAIQALAATKRLGGEVPKAAALVLDDENVAGMVKRGIISPELAIKIWKMKRQ